MKDKNGVEYRVGDVVLMFGEGVEFRISSAFPTVQHDRPFSGHFGFPGEHVIISRADGSDPRRPELYGGIWARKEVEMMCDAIQSAAVALAKPLPRAPHELYAEFRKVVEETVRREAPKVRVVTDFSGVTGHYWLSLDGIHQDGSVPLASADGGWTAHMVRASIQSIGDGVKRRAFR